MMKMILKYGLKKERIKICSNLLHISNIIILLVRSKVKTTTFQAVRFIYDFLAYDIVLN